MKTKFKINFVSGLLLMIAVGLASCKKEKDQQIPPQISFKTGSGYVSSDGTFPKNDTITVGITAQKSEDKDLLTRFVATQSYDGVAATTILNESFNQDSYSKDMKIITRNVAGYEKYTYTIINRDGLTKTLSLTLTVN